MKEIKTDVCIIGIGAGGFGCLHRLSEYNIKTVAVEKNVAFGGTAVFSGVNCWEPGVSLDGVHLLIKDALEKIPDGCMVAKTVPNCRLIDKTDEQSFEKYPWGLSVRADEDYYSTLKRCMHYNGADALKYRRFQFEGEAMAAVMKRLTDKNCVKSMLGYTLTDVEKKRRNNHFGNCEKRESCGKNFCRLFCGFYRRYMPCADGGLQNDIGHGGVRNL